MKINILL
jgi:hypothetical protein